MNRKDIVSLMEAYDVVNSLDKNPQTEIALSPESQPEAEPNIDIGYAELKDLGEESQKMTVSNLQSIRSHAYEILSILDNGVVVEPWMQEKLAIAKDYIVSVTDAIMYRK
jgi:hypothetical protein